MNKIQHCIGLIGFIGTIGCAEGEALIRGETLSEAPPCVPEWEFRCRSGGVAMTDVKCGSESKQVMQCPYGCVQGLCLEQGEMPTVDDCSPSWKAECMGAGVALVDHTCPNKPEMITDMCVAGCELGVCNPPETNKSEEEDSETETDVVDEPEPEPEPEYVCEGKEWIKVVGDEKTSIESCDYQCDPLIGCVPDPCPVKAAFRACHSDNVWNFDSCNVPHSVAEFCETGCNGQNCAPTHNVFTTVVKFQPPPLLKVCPIHIGGDPDYKGNGPIMDIFVGLVYGRSDMYVRTIVHAIETKSDYTEGYVDEQREIWRAPEGCEIDGVLGPEGASVSYTDRDHHPDIFELGPDGLLSTIIANGDSKGNDLVGCINNRGTWVTAYFNPIRVQVTCTTAQK